MKAVVRLRAGAAPALAALLAAVESDSIPAQNQIPQSDHGYSLQSSRYLDAAADGPQFDP
jgi:hypothetical protein